MKQLDLFAGIGGISLAAEWAGIETVAFCEKEPFAQGILRRRFPGRPIYDDVFNLTREVLERDGITGINIVAGGFPCQPFSHAGRRTGTTDDRYLWPQMCRIIGELRPSWVFAENVDGLVSMAQPDWELVVEDETAICEEAEMVLESIRQDLKAIGYSSIAIIIPACGIGASHRRYRIFILGHTEHLGSHGSTFGGSLDSAGNDNAKRADTACKFTGASGRADDAALGYTVRSGCDGDQRGQPKQEFEVGCQDVADSKSERCREARRHQSGRSEEWPASGGEVMADTSFELPYGIRREGRGRDEHPNSSETLADTSGERTGRVSVRSRGSLQTPSDIVGSSEDVADTSSNGQPKPRKFLKPFYPVQGRGWETNESFDERFGKKWSAQPGMGRGPYELSDWLDGWGMNPLDALIQIISTYPQPALMGQEQHAWEPPRVATGVKNRAARLKALGNAVDPLQALPVLYGIRVLHEHLMEGRSL